MLQPDVPRIRSASVNAQKMLSGMLLLVVALFGCVLVGSRSLDVGTDTLTYAKFFLSFDHQGTVTTRLEPGFVLVTGLLRYLGFSVHAYQAALFGLMLLSIVLASRKYFDYLDEPRRYLTYLIACTALLYVSPMFVNATINTVRQGIASLIVFTALLCFYRRQWRQFLLYGALASSVHYSSLLYLACAPLLLLSTRNMRIIGCLAFVLYCSGLSQILVRALLPSLYNAVMDHEANTNFRVGTRIDFAVFSIFWYLLIYFGANLVRSPVDAKLRQSASIYLVLTLPFFLVGWGSFSNRYLLPAWLAASLFVAALLYYSRIALLREPLLLATLLIGACGAYFYYVTHLVII